MITEIDETFYEITGYRLANTSQLKLFTILKDLDKNEYFLSIFNSYVISDSLEDKVYYDLYEVGENEWWDDISNKYYGTPYLWWSIAMVNQVVNPFEELIEGSMISVLKPNYIYQFLKEVRTVGLGG